MNLGIYPDKSFSEDIKVFKEKLEHKEPFTFSKFADGEWFAMRNITVYNNEFQFSKSREHAEARKDLINAFQFCHPNYYVGISCPCCQGSAFEDMKEYSNQADARLTWANMWVNSNYKYFLSDILPLFSNYKVALVAHKDSNLDNLPFRDSIKAFYPIDKDAWVVNQDEVVTLKRRIAKEKMKGWLFLFCCGPFGNILAHRLTECDEENTYLDIGSTLNPFLGTEGFRRAYFDNHENMKPCIWR